MTKPDFSYLHSIRIEINTILADYANQNPPHQDLSNFSSECNRILLSDGAKRIRSMIPVLIGDCLGLERSKCLLMGVIIEKLHFTSLVHDDVIDNEEVRRGFPTLNSSFARNHAVLIGDLMMCDVIDHTMKHDYNNEAIALLSQAVRKLVTGVIIEQSTLPQNPSLEKYIEMAQFKTGSLFQLAFGLPFIATAHFETAFLCGNLFGLLFQIYDDFLDQETDGENQNIFHFISPEEIQDYCNKAMDELLDYSKTLGIAEAVDLIISYLQSHGYLKTERLSSLC